jgi:hypothetical protein
MKPRILSRRPEASRRGSQLIHLSVALSLLLLPTLRASIVVHFHASPAGARVENEAGQPIAASSEVRIGTLPEGFNPAQVAWDPSELARVWRPFGGTATKALFGQQSRFAGTATSLDGAFAGRRIFLWILRTSDGLPVRADLGNVAAQALLSSASPRWIFPSSAAIPPLNATAINLQDAELMFWGVRVTSAVRTQSPGLTFHEWMQVMLDDHADRIAGADPDRDTKTNFAEFVFGGFPALPDLIAREHGFVVEGGKTYLTVSVRRSPWRLNTVLGVEGSSDLHAWVPGLLLDQQLNADGTETVIFRDSVAVEDSPKKRFLRVIGAEAPAPAP